jgi:hypothetical protein
LAGIHPIKRTIPQNCAILHRVGRLLHRVGRSRFMQLVRYP